MGTPDPCESRRTEGRRTTEWARLQPRCRCPSSVGCQRTRWGGDTRWVYTNLGQEGAIVRAHERETEHHRVGGGVAQRRVRDVARDHLLRGGSASANPQRGQRRSQSWRRVPATAHRFRPRERRQARRPTTQQRRAEPAEPRTYRSLSDEVQRGDGLLHGAG